MLLARTNKVLLIPLCKSKVLNIHPYPPIVYRNFLYQFGSISFNSVENESKIKSIKANENQPKLNDYIDESDISSNIIFSNSSMTQSETTETLTESIETQLKNNRLIQETEKKLKNNALPVLKKSTSTNLTKTFETSVEKDRIPLSSAANTQSITPTTATSTVNSNSPLFATTKPLRSIMLFASEVAPLVGLSSWRPFPEIFESLWQRNDPSSYNNAKSIVQKVENRQILTREQEALQYIENTPVEALINSLLPVVSSMDNKQFQSVEQLLTSAVHVHIPIEHQQIVLNNELSRLRKQVGIQNEQKAINTIERVTSKPVVDSNKTFYSKKIGKCEYLPQYYDKTLLKTSLEQWLSNYNNHITIQDLNINFDLDISSHTLLHREWLVGGKVDGFNNGELIEIKNRTKSIPDSVPFYDRAQFEVYLQVLGLKHGLLVERLQHKSSSPSNIDGHSDNTESSMETTRTTKFERNDEVWSKTLVPRLAKFSNYLHTFLLQPARQIELMRAKTDGEKAIQLAQIIPVLIKERKR